MADRFNLLIDRLPHIVQVDGGWYPIRTNFRISLEAELLLWDTRVPDEDKVWEVVGMYFYPQRVPKDIYGAYEAAMAFFAEGRSSKRLRKRQEAQERGRYGAVAKTKRLYDFDADAPMIFAAFLDQYGMDLQDIDYLHWWKFSAMFASLDKRHEFCNIMQIRAADTSQIKDKREAGRIRRLQHLYRIEDSMTTEDRAKQIYEMYGVKQDVGTTAQAGHE